MWCMVKQPKKRRGRPPAGDKPMVQLAVRLTQEQIAAVDTIIEDREGVPDRTTIIREMLTKGLKAYGAL
jgi:metal-responsive CopG/Arc/MetJ family transcriptional regulator